MQEKRSKDQIKAQILALCQEDGANKTRIVYQVGLNFRTVNGSLCPRFYRCSSLGVV
jgi:predicted transcriptional regulator